MHVVRKVGTRDPGSLGCHPAPLAPVLVTHTLGRRVRGATQGPSTTTPRPQPRLTHRQVPSLLPPHMTSRRVAAWRDEAAGLHTAWEKESGSLVTG